jgi:hypothetical protein
MAGRTLGRAGGKEMVEDIALWGVISRSRNAQGIFLEVQRGKEVIAGDPARRPSKEEVNRAFAGGLGATINTLNPTISRTLNEAAAAIYVQRGGRTGTDSARNPQFDEDLYLSSLREALGGQRDNENTGFADFSGGRVDELTILPPGISRQGFETWQERLTPQTLGGTPFDKNGRPLDIDVIRDEGVFIMVAPEVYGVKLKSDGGWVANRAGGQLRIRMTRR